MNCVPQRGGRDAVPGRQGAQARPRPPPKPWVTVILDEFPGSAEAMSTGIAEAMLREAPLLAVTSWSTTDCAPGVAHSDLKTLLAHYLAASSDDEAHIRVCALRMPHDFLRLLNDTAHTDDGRCSRSQQRGRPRTPESLGRRDATQGRMLSAGRSWRG